MQIVPTITHPNHSTWEGSLKNNKKALNTKNILKRVKSRSENDETKLFKNIPKKGL
jgi:hypothetical protein